MRLQLGHIILTLKKGKEVTLFYIVNNFYVMMGVMISDRSFAALRLNH